MADPETIITVQDLSSGYDKARVLQDVSFEVKRGEILAIIGKSGCGKTTLLKNMLGLIPYQSGSIRIFDTEVADRENMEKRRIQKRMGVLFQRGALLNSMTVGENVALPLEMHTRKSRKEIGKIVFEKLDLVRLYYAHHKFPTQLSGGMVKRAALARAMALDPEILLCDEPSAGLDPVTTKHLDGLLLDLKTRFSMTIIIVTHDILSIERTADRIIMLDQHRIVYNDTAKSIRISHVQALRDFFLMPQEGNGVNGRETI